MAYTYKYVLKKRFWGSGAKQMEQILFKVAQSYDDAHYNSWIIVCAADFSQHTSFKLNISRHHGCNMSTNLPMQQQGVMLTCVVHPYRTTRCIIRHNAEHDNAAPAYRGEAYINGYTSNVLYTTTNMKNLLVGLSLLASAFVSTQAANTGVDVSALTSTSAWSCAKNYGYSHAIIRCYFEAWGGNPVCKTSHCS